MNTIDTIIRELEKIPESIQLTVLDFIRSLGSSSTATNSTGAETEVSHNQHPAGKRQDPFDRLIIATALVHDAKLASVDNLFTLYPEIGDRLLSS